MELTTLIVLLAVALVVMAIVVGALVVRLIHKNNELKEKNDVIVREVRRNQRLIDRAVQQGVSRAAMLSVALLCMVVQGAWAEDVNYIYYTVLDVNNKVSLNKFNGTVSNPTVLTSKLLEDSPEDNLGTGWYVLDTSFEYGERIVISGDVHLILKDGCTLTAKKGIRINTDATLTIYTQKQVGDGMGRIVAQIAEHDKAAIGGNKNYQAGRLVIHGGEIEATCLEGSKYAAGIGGGYGDGSGMKEITIYGGKVTAQGAKSGAGIGGGKNNNKLGAITIYGGTVNATGGDYGAGIGGGENRDGGTISICGGTINATGGICGAGIGGGDEGNGGNIHIIGGDITARGKGEFEAWSEGDGAGIGGGDEGNGGTITIDGGVIKAYGACDSWTAAGIGGGNEGDAGVININGGNIYVEGGRRWDDWGANYGSAGIGAGYEGTKGTITISGGYVKTIGGPTAGSIGCHQEFTFRGTLTFKNYRKVTNDINTVAIANKRKHFCIDGVYFDENGIGKRFNNIVCTSVIEDCDHAELLYTCTADNHTAKCKYCEYRKSEAHSYAAPSTTCVCGYGSEATICTLSFYETATASTTDYLASGTPYAEGRTIVLPEYTQVPDGMTFVGWLKQGNTPASIETTDNETLLQPGDEYTVNGSETFYARYRYQYTCSWLWQPDHANVTLYVKRASQSGPGQAVSGVTVTSKAVEATATTPGYTVYTATANYKPNDYTYTFTDQQTVVNYTTVELDETDNTTTLETSNGLEAKAALTGRTLYKNGKWNTLCLPFSVADISSSPLAGATIKELADATFAGGTLTLTFADATSIEAGHAYLIKWDSGSNLGPSDLIFTGVTLTNYLCEDGISTDNSGTATVTFMGTYKKLSFDADDKSILFLGENNTLYYPQSGAAIGAQRAYFKLSGITAGDKTISGARTFVLDFGDNNTTGVIELKDGKMEELKFFDSWYSLDGKHLSGKPAQKGIYINNGKKIIIK